MVDPAGVESAITKQSSSQEHLHYHLDPNIDLPIQGDQAAIDKH